MSEQRRIEFLIERDGLPQATDWVRRTMYIYRGAVLTRGHFARPILTGTASSLRIWSSRDGYERVPPPGRRDGGFSGTSFMAVNAGTSGWIASAKMSPADVRVFCVLAGGE